MSVPEIRAASGQDERAARATSFGSVAEDYDRWRPAPDPIVADWLLPDGATDVVELGAGTGALTRLLVERAPRVVAVEPDARMRAVLAANVPQAEVLEGRGDQIPMPNRSADAVLASSAWHWMDTPATIEEVARVLRTGGVLGVAWSGIDRNGSWLSEVRARAREAGEIFLRAGPLRDVDAGGSSGDPADGRPSSGRAGSDRPGSPEVVGGRPGSPEADGGRPGSPEPDGGRPGSPEAGGGRPGSPEADGGRPGWRRGLYLPDGSPFGKLEHEVLHWTRPVSAEQLVNMTGTFSGVIMLPAEERQHLMNEARRLLREIAGLEGSDTVELPFRAQCWKAVRTGD